MLFLIKNMDPSDPRKRFDRMKNRKLIASTLAALLLSALMAASLLPAVSIEAGASNMFENSDFIETEQPELNAETKTLISLYQRQPTQAHYLELRNTVIANYDAVLVRKEAKLAELRAETAGKPGGDAKVAEMEEIVQEMYMTYWNRINSSMPVSYTHLRYSGKQERLLRSEGYHLRLSAPGGGKTGGTLCGGAEEICFPLCQQQTGRKG